MLVLGSGAGAGAGLVLVLVLCWCLVLALLVRGSGYEGFVTNGRTLGHAARRI